MECSLVCFQWTEKNKTRFLTWHSRNTSFTFIHFFSGHNRRKHRTKPSDQFRFQVLIPSSPWKYIPITLEVLKNSAKKTPPLHPLLGMGTLSADFATANLSTHVCIRIRQRLSGYSIPACIARNFDHSRDSCTHTAQNSSGMCLSIPKFRWCCRHMTDSQAGWLFEDWNKKICRYHS